MKSTARPGHPIRASDQRLSRADERNTKPESAPSALHIIPHMFTAAVHRRGFTLLELLIVIVIVAILAAIALPAFTESVRKGRRAEAVALLTGLQQAQERYRANNANYATALGQLSPVPNSSGEHYGLSITSASANAYTLTATALGSSPQASDTKCSTMSVVMSAGGILQYGSGSGSASAIGARNVCWNN